MAVRETLEFDLREALAKVNAFEKELNDLSKPIKIPIDIGDPGQIRLTASEYREVTRAIEAGVTPARAIADATGQTLRVASLAEADFRDMAAALNVSEDEARLVASSIFDARKASLQTADAAKDIARQLGLSESEAAEFASEMRTAANRTDDVNRGAVNASGGLERLRTGFSRVVIAAAAFVGIRELARFANDSIQAFSRLNESTSKAEVVFGQFADTVFDFTENAPIQLGQTQQAAIDAAGSLGNLFLSTGLSQEAAAQMSIDIVQLGTDLASFNDLTVDESLLKLRSGLVGETEPLRTVGVLLSEAAVQAKAFELGLGGATGKLTEGEKVQARYALILEQTSTAQGDFARTSEGIANSQRTVQALFGELQTKIGEGLAPAYKQLIDLAPDVIGGFEDMIPSIAAAALALGDFFAPKEGQADLLDILNFLTDLTRGFQQLAATGPANIGILGGLNETIAGLVGLDFDRATAGLGGVVDAVNELGESSVARVAIQDLVQSMREGEPAAAAFSTALAFIGRKGIVDLQTVKNLQAIAGLDTTAARFELNKLIADAERLGFSADEVAILERAVFDLNAAFFEGGRGNADYMASMAGIQSAVESSTPALQSQATVLFLLRSEADLLGVSIGEILTNAGNFPELAGLIGQLEPATAQLALAGDRLDTFAATFETTNVRVSDAIDELGKLPEKLEVTKNQFLENLTISAAEEAEFQSNLIKLFAIDEELATSLRDRGPAARGLVEDFLADTFSAERAGDILRGEAEDITGKFTDDVTEFIEGSDLDAAGITALELFLEGFGNTVVAETGVAALQELLQGEIEKMRFTLSSGQFSFEAGGEPFTGGGIVGGGGVPSGGGGGVVVNINNPVAQDLPTNAAQAGQSIGAASATFNRIGGT